MPATAVLGDTLVLLLAIPLVLAPLLIGTRFHSWWWVLGPPTAIFALLMPSTLHKTASQVALNWEISHLIHMGLFYGGLAAIGVWWGIRREKRLH